MAKARRAGLDDLTRPAPAPKELAIPVCSGEVWEGTLTAIKEHFT